LSQEERPLFLRKATGLVRAWSSFDAFLYAFFSVNIVTLGLYGYSYAAFWPSSNLIPAIVISTCFIVFLVITYAMLISAMPRAGGDYVWETRILGGFIGFVAAINGWITCLWLWGPIYGNMVQVQIVAPLLVTLGYTDAALWWTTANGVFLGTLISAIYVSVIVGLGMRWYARIQKISFYIGMAGLVSFVIVLALGSQPAFIAAFNSFAQGTFGHANAYSDTIALATSEGYAHTPFEASLVDISAAGALIPLVAFYNLWPNWGATLYGEVKGASDYRRNMKQMMWANILGGVGGIVLLLLIYNTFGYEFYQTSNYAYWMQSYGGTAPPLPIYPFGPLLASLMFKNPLLTLWLIVSMSFWFWGWAGTLFLSSTRAMFAMAFDRTLPSWLGQVSTRFGAPLNTIIVMFVATMLLGTLYSYVPGVAVIFLDATLAIAAMYFITSIAAAVFPYRKKKLFEASPIAKYKVGGMPAITICGAITALYLFYLLVMWVKDPSYGVNNPISALYLGATYIGSAILYFGMKAYRKRQGIDINRIYGEIPSE
jgi:APA family basic amino acid/polyamine antiporter